MLGVQLQRTKITLDPHIDGVVIGHLGIIQLNIDTREVIPSDRIIRRDFHEALIVPLRLHILLLIRVESAQIEERQHVMGKDL